MKIKLVLLLLLSLMIFCCKEEKKIEIIPNLETEYLSENEVDKPAEFISGKKDLIDAIKSIHDFQNKDSLRYIIKLRLYINAHGRIDKVKDISDIYDRSEFSPDGVKNYTSRDKLNEALSVQLTDLIFKPALKEGKNVKSWKDVKDVNILANPDRSFQIEMPNFLAELPFSPKSPFDPKSQYLIVAEEMPEPIGGIKEIQKRVLYPVLAKRAGIQGKVYVLTFIDEYGRVVQAKIIKGIGAGCDEAALEAVKSVKFKPGRNNGKPVKTQVSIPIMFKLQ